MTWELGFHQAALRDWSRLDSEDQRRFRKILARRLVEPMVFGDRLSGPLHDCWRIKLQSSGRRLVYRLRPETGILEILSVGARSDKEAYRLAARRLED